MAATTFSDYLGQKHYKKSKKSKIYADLGFETFRQSFWKNDHFRQQDEVALNNVAFSKF